MASIQLNEMTFFAPIGVYPEEKILKNEIVVQVKLSMLHLLDVKTLNNTIDYSEIYLLIEKEVQQACDLLEDTLQRILISIRDYIKDQKDLAFHVNAIHASITKKNPPIQGQIASVTIEDTLYDYQIKQKKCSRCSAPFECNDQGNGCWCTNLNITENQLKIINEKFDNCLCEKCLNEVIK